MLMTLMMLASPMIKHRWLYAEESGENFLLFSVLTLIWSDCENCGNDDDEDNDDGDDDNDDDEDMKEVEVVAVDLCT